MSEPKAQFTTQPGTIFGVLVNGPSNPRSPFVIPVVGPRKGDRILSVCLPVPPSANRYWRYGRGHVYVSDEALAYKQQVRYLLGQIDPFTSGVSVQFLVYRRNNKGDLDNYQKVLYDALKGILYPDDNAVLEFHGLRKDDKKNPRVVLTAWETRSVV